MQTLFLNKLKLQNNYIYRNFIVASLENLKIRKFTVYTNNTTCICRTIEFWVLCFLADKIATIAKVLTGFTENLMNCEFLKSDVLLIMGVCHFGIAEIFAERFNTQCVARLWLYILFYIYVSFWWANKLK